MPDISSIILLGLRFALAIILYGFLGYTIKIIWRDIKTSDTKRADKHPSITLKIDGIEYLPQTFIQEEIVLGRDPNCDLHFESSTVSGKHARLYYLHNQWWVEDLESSNGTIINTTLLDTPTVLVSNDILHLGESSVLVLIENNEIKQ